MNHFHAQSNWGGGLELQNTGLGCSLVQPNWVSVFMRQDQWCSPLCPVAVSMAGFRHNHTKPSGWTGLVDRMECWALKHKAFQTDYLSSLFWGRRKKCADGQKPFSLYLRLVVVFLCMCVCVCERETEYRKRGGRERATSMGTTQILKRCRAAQIDLTAPLSTGNTHSVKAINVFLFWTMSGIINVPS